MEKIYKIKKLLKDITKSKNYEVIETSGGSTEVICRIKKELHPIDINNGRDYTILMHFYKGSEHDFAETCHVLKVAKELKGMREPNMSLCQFIREVERFFGMCTSLICYGWGMKDEYFNDRTFYNLPRSTKEAMYNYTKGIVKHIAYGVHTDNEGCTYNSMELLPC